jgi:hypothetical protein
LIDDQVPRGACCDETMATTARERAALAAFGALPGRIIGVGRKAARGAAVKRKRPLQPAVGINPDLGYSYLR